jgi:hypothetical protein
MVVFNFIPHHRFVVVREAAGENRKDNDLFLISQRRRRLPPGVSVFHREKEILIKVFSASLNKRSERRAFPDYHKCKH